MAFFKVPRITWITGGAPNSFEANEYGKDELLSMRDVAGAMPHILQEHKTYVDLPAVFLIYLKVTSVKGSHCYL